MLAIAILAGTLLGITSQTLAQPIPPAVIGKTHVVEGKETPHPYAAAAVKDAIVWSDTITHEGATLIKVLLSDFALAEGDYVIVRDPDSNQVDRYDSTWPREFWSLSIFGDEAIIELNTTGAVGGHGFRIAGYAESGVQPCFVFDLCGVNVQCPPAAGGPPPAVFPLRGPVCGLLTAGAPPGALKFCTGYQIDHAGQIGYILTNKHCEPPIGGWAFNAEAWFNSEVFDCPPVLGDLKTISQYVVTFEECFSPLKPAGLDYSLLEIVPLPGNCAPGVWGKLPLRNGPPIPGEAVHMFHHSCGCQKQYGSGVILGVAPNNANYWDYTVFASFGSSGSPVIADLDRCVIALNGYVGTGQPIPTCFPPFCVWTKGSAMVAVIADMAAQGCLPPGVILCAPVCADPVSVRAGGVCTLTQSLDTVTIQIPNTVACQESDVGTTENGWTRCYNLALEGVPGGGPLTINSVTFGVQQATINGINVDVNLYVDCNGCPPGEPGVDAILLATKSIMVNTADEGTFITVDFTDLAPVVPAGAGLIVEIEQVDDGTEPPEFFFRPAGNDAGQCAPSYLRAADCGIRGWVDLWDIDFPDAHLIQIIDATVGGVPTVECELGTIATGPNSAVDGYLDVAPDAYGSWVTTVWGGRADHFNPLGAAPLQEAAFTSGLFMFVGGTQRELLSQNELWEGVFGADTSLSTQITAGGVTSDTDGDGIDDTTISSFNVTGDGVNLSFDLVQRVESLGGGVALLTQTYTITNNGAALDFTLVSVFDGDLIWVGDLGDDSVGTGTNGAHGLDRFVFEQEAGDPATAITLSSPTGDAYVGSKQGIDPDGDGPDPPFGFGTDTEIWDNFGIPTSWRNYIAGIGTGTNGESGASPPGCGDPCDALAVLEIPVSVASGVDTTIVVVQHTYGANTPSGKTPPPCLGDLDNSGDVGVKDLLFLLGAWGPCDEPCPPSCLADFDGNCDVGVKDLLILLGNWGPCPK